MKMKKQKIHQKKFNIRNYKNIEKSVIGKKIRLKSLNSATPVIKGDSEFMKIIENSFSFKPTMKLCDITGLPANYTDPESSLNFRDSGIFEFAKEIKMVGIVPYINLREFGKKNDPFSNFLNN